MARLRFSLRNLLILILILTTLLCIVLGTWVYRSSSQRAKLNILREQGYNVSYQPVGKVRTWLSEYLGEDFVATPLGLYCNGEPTIGTVAKLPSIEKLVLSVTKVNDQDLGEIAGMPKINFLVLNDTDVTDNGIRHLISLPLISLDLSGLPITDKCVLHLVKIDTLRQITISANTITPKGQRKLASVLPRCLVRVQ